jgi:CheY-like chemotaxis protein
MSTVRVLIVDDDEVVCSSLTSVLEERGFAVTCATSVAEALERMSSETYDVLLGGLHAPPHLETHWARRSNE